MSRPTCACEPGPLALADDPDRCLRCGRALPLARFSNATLIEALVRKAGLIEPRQTIDARKP